MRGQNQFSKLKRRNTSPKEEKSVDELIQNVLDNPLPESEEEITEDFSQEQFIPRPGNQSSLSLRRKLIKLYGHADNPAVQLLIGGVVRMYSFQKKAESPDAILKL